MGLELKTKESLYEEYQLKLHRLEQDREGYAVKKRAFEAEYEKRQMEMKTDYRQMEAFLENCGDSSEVNRLRREMAETFEAERAELKKKAEQLEEEEKNLLRQEQICSDAYWDEIRRLEEKEWEQSYIPLI